MATLGWAIVAVIAINGLFAFAQEYRAQRAIDALSRLLPQTAHVFRNGVIQEVLATELVPGDVIELDSGALIPADCVLLQAYAVRVNNATITGESVPQLRDASPSPVDVLNARNILLAGTVLAAGRARAVVYATGTKTQFGRIAHLTQTGIKQSSPLLDETRRLSRWTAMLASGIGALFLCSAIGWDCRFGQTSCSRSASSARSYPKGCLPPSPWRLRSRLDEWSDVRR